MPEIRKKSLGYDKASKERKLKILEASVKEFNAEVERFKKAQAELKEAGDRLGRTAWAILPLDDSAFPDEITNVLDPMMERLTRAVENYDRRIEQRMKGYVSTYILEDEKSKKTQRKKRGR